MFNVCLSPFVSSAHGSLIHQDGYELENLLHLDLKKRQKGFQIERFVRPPLTLDISFVAPVNIHYLVIWMGLNGDNERCKVDIFSSSSSDQISHLGVHNPSNQGGNNRFCGSFVLQTATPIILLRNSLLPVVHLHKDTTSDIPNKVLGSQVCERLVCQQISSQSLKPISQLTTTTNLTVCFKQYVGSRPLCIKCLEVWGQPSKRCTGDQLKCFEKGKQSCLESLLQPGLSSGSSSSSTLFYSCASAEPPKESRLSTTHTQTNVNTILDNDLAPTIPNAKNKIEPTPTHNASCKEKEGKRNTVPEKFLDQLTFDMMVLPYQLPSGYYVDQLTVEKCKENDLLYGRPPSDPFTGVPYSSNSQPIFCPRLKAELDILVTELSTSNDCTLQSDLGQRTVGSADEIIKHRSLIGNKRKLSKWKDNIPSNNIVSQKPCLDTDSNERSAIIPATDNTSSIRTASSSSRHVECEWSNVAADKGDKKSQHRKQDYDHERHQKTLEQTLNEALKHLYPSSS